MSLLDDIHEQLGHDALVKWDRALIDLPEETPAAWQNTSTRLLRDHSIYIVNRAVECPHLSVVMHGGWYVAIWDEVDWHQRILPRPGSANYADNERLDDFERRAARARPEPVRAAFERAHGQWDPVDCGTCRRAAEWLEL